MKIEMILAVAENCVIGYQGDMPWRLPADLKHFKETTMGLPIIMGRLTWASLGRALPGRLNIVISSKDLDLPDGVVHERGRRVLLHEGCELARHERVPHCAVQCAVQSMRTVVRRPTQSVRQRTHTSQSTAHSNHSSCTGA